MAVAYHHSLSSVKRWGGVVDDYLAIHEWLDESKGAFADFRHRAIKHHAEGIAECVAWFGPYVVTAGDRVVPTSWVAEQHVREDCGGRIPNLADWLRCIVPQPWMNRSRKLSKELESENAGWSHEAASAEAVAGS